MRLKISSLTTRLDSENQICTDKISLKQNYYLQLHNYKTERCNIESSHNFKKCYLYHNQNDKRRNLLNYKIQLCKYKEGCTKGNDCNFSHNKIEILYHLNFYKKKYCVNFYTSGNCDFGSNCSFAHSDKELRIKLIHLMKFDTDFFLNHFKTEFCPLGNIVHKKETCAYAHNYQEYKRKTLIYKLPIKCNNWNEKHCYKDYTKGCRFGFKCYYLHGKNEFIYHPSNYINLKYNSNKNSLLNYSYFSIGVKKRQQY